MQENPALAWHALPSDQILTSLKSGPEGLAPEEAEARLLRTGPNQLPTAAVRSNWVRFLQQFNNLLIYVLAGAALLTLLLQHFIDAGVILAVIVINAVIGFVQEGRAEKALDAIRSLLDPKATVLREGQRVTVAADRIVPGDVVLFEPGDRIPADLRLMRTKNLQIDEAILTGESLPVMKSTDPVAGGAMPGDRRSMAFSGTLVAAGQGVGVVVGTGANTEIGRISTLISNVQSLKTPLTRQMDGFARRLTFFILAVSVVTFLFALFMRDYQLADAFMAVVGLAVAAIPEGLPATMTITLAIGVQRMAGRNAIVRQLPAVETLGSISVICSDKTGTLTRNEMTVQMLATAERTFGITGVGYAPHGAFHSGDRDVDVTADDVVCDIARAALLCNDATLLQRDGHWQVDGDPMEGALITFALKAGLDQVLDRKQLPRDDEIPFDAAHRFMATLHHSHAHGAMVFLKGAPESVIEMCDFECVQSGTQPIDREAWHRRADELAAQGQRVLCLARKPMQMTDRTLSFDDVAGAMVLLGLVGLIDPPRDEAVNAMKDCKKAGIRVLMITGDHAITAREIARQLGLADDPQTLTGQQLEQLDDEALRKAVLVTTVFARTTPEQKLRLVEALQAGGLTVAMTGDGVNDAPALKRADVGVAMGRKGTEAAKQAAEMVLADDNFESIVASIREGRTVYDNLVKVLAWTLPTNGGEALTILTAIAFGLALPITPLQILWINMVTAAALGLTLAFEPTEPGTMSRPPRPPGLPILGGRLVWRIAFVSVLVLSGAFGMFYWAEDQELPVDAARTLVVNTIVVMEIFYLFSVRYVHGTSITWRGVLGTKAVLIGVGIVTVAQFVFTYAPPMQSVFETRAVGFWYGVAVLLPGIVLLVVVEIEKRIHRHFWMPVADWKCP